MTESDKIRQKLRTTINVLRKYTHHPNCTEIYSCPYKHVDCQKRLDLDTAIAWEVADALDALNYDLYITDSPGPASLREWRIRAIEISLNRIDAFYSILLRHKQSYSHLIAELENVGEILEQITQTLSSVEGE